MNPKYLYIEKRQRVKTAKELPRRAIRIKEELEKLGVEYKIAFNDEIELDFSNSELTIKVAGENILDYSHIFFGGHLTTRDYEIKNILVDHIEKFNARDETQKIHIQNSRFMKKMPYYNKVYMAKMCIDYGLPHLATHYETGGQYIENAQLTYPLIAKHYSGENEILTINEKDKVKKNVFKVSNQQDWNQVRLEGKKLNEFITQEFSPVGEDYRIFISNGKIVGGWKRKANGTFMTVTKGAEYTYYNDPSQEIRDICEKVVELWEPDFMALDFIYMNDIPYILEYSMHPGFHAYENKCTGGEPANIAEAIVKSFRE